MNVEKLLTDFKSGKLSQEQALQQLRDLPFSDLKFAKLDTHRQLRKGFPEVIFCEGKTREQILAIFCEMLKHNSNILATRANEEIFTAVKQLCPSATHNEVARTIFLQREKPKPLRGKLLIISAGTSDIPVAEEAIVTASALGCKVERLFDVGVAGLHRLLSNRKSFDSADVLIVIAGMDGALPSVVSGLTRKPVIAVPTSVGYGASFDGLAALLTMLNSCSPGVAVVNIDNGFGAGYLAATILQK